VAAATASRLTSGISLKGEISGREDLWIGGKVDGTLRFESARVVVGASGKVQGEIEAREIVVEGNMDGDLHAAERLEIAPTGNVRGDASAPRIALQEGALFNGHVEVVRAGESRSASQGGAAAGRTAQASRGSRPQSAHAAGAAASAGAPAAASGAPASDSADAKSGGSASSTAALLRGIGVDTSERSE
jgi:cytoskeletal protein CcmA (bactofilin family)